MNILLAKFKALPKYQKGVVIIVAIVLLGGLINLNEKYNPAREKRSSTATKSCLGNETCISTVRANFKNTGKTILGEEYLGNGKFGISLMDYQHAGSVYNATVITDCNCTVLDVNISTAR